jgi:hypothetical protein
MTRFGGWQRWSCKTTGEYFARHDPLTRTLQPCSNAAYEPVASWRRMRKQMTLDASVAQASMITPSRSYRTRRRRRPLSQLIVRSTTHRTLPSPLPCGVFRLAMCGSIPNQRSSVLKGSLS